MSLCAGKKLFLNLFSWKDAKSVLNMINEKHHPGTYLSLFNNG